MNIYIGHQEFGIALLSVLGLVAYWFIGAMLVYSLIWSDATTKKSSHIVAGLVTLFWPVLAFVYFPIWFLGKLSNKIE